MQEGRAKKREAEIDRGQSANPSGDKRIKVSLVHPPLPIFKTFGQRHQNLSFAKPFFHLQTKKQWQVPRKGGDLRGASAGKGVFDSRNIEPGDVGIWATCDMHKEARSVSELKVLFEEVSGILLFLPANGQFNGSFSTIKPRSNLGSSGCGAVRTRYVLLMLIDYLIQKAKALYGLGSEEISELKDSKEDIEDDIAKELAQIRDPTSKTKHFKSVKIDTKCSTLALSRHPSLTNSSFILQNKPANRSSGLLVVPMRGCCCRVSKETNSNSASNDASQPGWQGHCNGR
jgi:hypothetical protein